MRVLYSEVWCQVESSISRMCISKYAAKCSSLSGWRNIWFGPQLESDLGALYAARPGNLTLLLGTGRRSADEAGTAGGSGPGRMR